MKSITTAIIALLALTSLHAKSQEIIKQKTINVAGMAQMEVVPDEIYVQVELREYDKKGSGKIDIQSIKDNFLKAAISTGLRDSDISVQGYQGWDGNYWWYKKNKKNNPDLKASITYEVKLSNTKKMDELVAKLDDEATQNFFISRVSHSKLQEFKKLLKIQAVQAAKDKAFYLAGAIGEHVGEALTINDPNEINPFQPNIYANRMMAMKAGADENNDASTPNVDFKKIKLQFEVNVTFALK